MAKDPVKRKHFVDSSVKFIKQHNFDGLDLDWEYPGNNQGEIWNVIQNMHDIWGKRGGAPEDKANFIALIQDLHAVFSKHKLLLTAAIGAAQGTIDAAYDVEKMYKYLVGREQHKIQMVNSSISGLCPRYGLRLPWQMGQEDRTQCTPSLSPYRASERPDTQCRIHPGISAQERGKAWENSAGSATLWESLHIDEP